MWIIPQSICSRFAPESRVWIWELLWLAPERGLSVTSSGKPTVRPFSWRGWQTRRWSRLLFGAATLRNLTGGNGMGPWTESLRESRASRTASPGSALGQRMSETYGLRLLGSLKRLNPNSCFLKTSAAQQDFFSNTLGENWSERVGGLRLDYSARQKLARRIGGKDSSCWPTPKSRDWKGGQGTKQKQDLDKICERWPCPSSPPAPRTSTDGATSSTDGRNSRRLWPTVRAAEAYQGLEAARAYKEAGFKQPTLRSGKKRNKSTYDTTLTTAAAAITGKKRLNPAFVEWLMGWPLGWTDFAPVEMESYLSRQRGRLYALLGAYSVRGEFV